MRIGRVNSSVNFKQIHFDTDISCMLMNNGEENYLNKVRNMSLDGFPIGRVTYDNDERAYVLNGYNPDTNKACQIILGHYITAERVENAINFYNMYPSER